MSWLDPLEPDDRLGQLLTDWRRELDDVAGNVMSTELPPLPSRPGRWVRAHRRTAAAAAVVVAIAGSTSVAAAASGSSGPLGGVHDFLYGPPAPRVVDYDAIQAKRILDSAEPRILAAQRAGSIKTTERVQLASRLDTVQALLDGDAAAPSTLATRLADLRHALAAIPAAAAPQPGSPSGSGGRDGTPGDDQSGHAGSTGQGSDDTQVGGGGHRSGSDDSHGDGSSSGGGSDDGTSSGGGSDDGSSGDGGSDDGSGGGGGSDDGSSGGGGSDDGSGGDQSNDGGSVDSSQSDSGTDSSDSADSSDSGDSGGGSSDLSAEGDD